VEILTVNKEHGLIHQCAAVVINYYLHGQAVLGATALASVAESVRTVCGVIFLHRDDTPYSLSSLGN
jgi:hypothetical protein